MIRIMKNLVFIDEDGNVDYKQYGKILDQLEDKIRECKIKDRKIEQLDKIKKIVDNEKITGIEAKLMIKDILEEIE